MIFFCDKMDIDLEEACSTTHTCTTIVEKTDIQKEIPSSSTNSNLIGPTTQILASKMLSESMSCLNDDSHHDLFPHSPDSAELSTISLPNSELHDTILREPIPPRPSSEGDQPSSTSAKSFKCTKCPYETDRKNNLKRHMTTMHDPAPSTLDCCGTRFATKGDLRDHTKAAHGAGYTCWQCGHTFCRRALLQRHQSVHSGHKAFSCAKCGYQSSHKSNMQRHMQVHLHAKVSGSPNFKDRFKNNVKGTFRPPLWQCSNVLSRQGHGAIGRSLTAINVKGLFEQSSRQASVHSESKTPSNCEPSMEVNQNTFHSRQEQGQFSKALSDMATVNLSVALKSQDYEKICEADYPVPRGVTNSESTFSAGIWRLAFGHQNVPNEMNRPHLQSILSRSADPDGLLQMAGSTIPKLASKQPAPELYLKSSCHQLSRKIAQSSSREEDCNYEPRFLTNRRDGAGNTESCGTHSLTHRSLPFSETSEGQSAFVKVRPSDGRIHRPIPRYGNRILDFSIGKFQPLISSTQQSNRERGIQISPQLDDARNEDGRQLEATLLLAPPKASGENFRKISPVPVHLCPNQLKAQSNTIRAASALDATIEHPCQLSLFRLENDRTNLTSRNSLENHPVLGFTRAEDPVPVVATTSSEPIDYSMKKKTVCGNALRNERIQAQNAFKTEISGYSIHTESEVSNDSTRNPTVDSTTISPCLGCNEASVKVSDNFLTCSSRNPAPKEVGNSDACRNNNLSLDRTLRYGLQEFVTDSSCGVSAVGSENEHLQDYIPKKLRVSRRKDL